ncbi:MAG: EAL domain-containing protein [Chromatiaceae bacterium]
MCTDTGISAIRTAGNPLRAVLAAIRSAVTRIRPKRRTRSLVGDILLVQLLLATTIGGLAIGGLWVIADAVTEHSLDRWAVAWITDLGSLGAPLYRKHPVDGARFLHIEDYVAKYPEIALVRYYSQDGVPLFERRSHTLAPTDKIAPLSSSQLERLKGMIKQKHPYLLDASHESANLLRVSAPVWTESLDAADLDNLDLRSTSRDNVHLVGFVELGLDFSRYHEQLLDNVLKGSLALALALLPLAVLGRNMLKRALKPLSELEAPLARLAAGDTNVEVSSGGHKEIAAIRRALRTTILALKERDKRLRRLADYDPLTGLRNRRSFAQKLNEEIARVGGRRRTTSALLFVDLDQFKYVNDTLGHAAGDRVLVQAASCLHGSVRPQDVVARFGGDEFAVLLHDVGPEEAQGIAAEILGVMRNDVFVEEGQSLNVLCSIGVTVFGSGAYTADELLSQADMACQESKTRGRNRYCVHKIYKSERSRIAADEGWSHQIQQALREDRFFLQYQPIIRLEDGMASVYEVLLRMSGDKKKTILPQAFLPAAHRFGMMSEIDRLVIDKALAALARFRREGYDIHFTLNLSGYAFEDPELVELIETHLDKNDLEPNLVIFEITEQVAVRHLAQARGLIQDLIRIGCRFALDDFGTGFSSFNYLKHLPAEFIKIDGGFIRNIADEAVDQAMVGSIIQVARAVGKRTIAEHVEDAPTLALLRQIGVDYAQGYYIGKPAGSLCTTPFPLAQMRSRRIRSA